MSISLDILIAVNEQVVTPSASGVDLGACFLSKNELIPNGVVLNFTRLEDVQNFFGASPESEYAAVYFKGFAGALQKPNTIKYARWVNEAISAIMISTPQQSLEQIKSYGTADMIFNTVNASGTTVQTQVTDFDLSTKASSYANLATALQEVLTNAGIEVSYNAGINSLIFKTAAKGENLKILPATFAGGEGKQDLGAILGIKVPFMSGSGSNTLSAALNLGNILNITSNFAAFVAPINLNDSEYLDMAKYISDLTNTYVLFIPNWDVQATLPVDTSSIMALIKKAGYARSCAIYNKDGKHAAFSASIGACIDYENGQSITWQWKRQDGLTPEPNITTEVAQNLWQNGYCFYSEYSSRTAEYRLFSNGQVSGPYKWLDALYNSIWLKNRLQTNMILFFQNIGKIAYNEAGYSKLRLSLFSVIDKALSNGVIDVKVALSDEQKTNAENLAGFDVSKELENTGYFLQIKDPGATVRANRGTPVILFLYVYGGAIQKIVIDSVQYQ